MSTPELPKFKSKDYLHQQMDRLTAFFQFRVARSSLAKNRHPSIENLCRGSSLGIVGRYSEGHEIGW